MTNQQTLAQQVANELRMLEKIRNFVISYDRGLLYPERFAMLVKDVMTDKEGTTCN